MKILPTVPPADPDLFHQAFELLCAEIEKATQEADIGPDTETAGLLAAMMRLGEDHGETMGDALAMRAYYLLRLIAKSRQIRDISLREQEDVQSALRDIICTMPMIATKVSAAGLLKKLAARGIHP